MSGQADYRLRIGFGGGIGGRFTIGVSTIGGTDVIANQWTEFFNGPYDDVTSYVADETQVVASRGWDDLLASLQSGTLDFVLADPPGQIGYFDPNDASSPLFTESPGFDAMRPVFLDASTDNWVTSQGLCYAFVRTARYDADPGSPTYATCAIHAEDLLLWMARIKNPIISTVSGITSSQAVGLVLDAFGYTDPSRRNLSDRPSITSMTFSADGTAGALDLLAAIVKAEQGRLYVDGDGIVVFEDRYARDRRRTATYSFDTQLVGVDSRASVDTIANRVTVTAGAGVPQVVEDTDSAQRYGIGDIGSIDTTYLPDDASAQALAQLIVKRRKDRHPPQIATVDNESSTVAGQQIALELQDRIAVSGTDGFYIERLTHAINAGGPYHRTDLLVTQAPSPMAFALGVSTFVAAGDLTGDFIS